MVSWFSWRVGAGASSHQMRAWSHRWQSSHQSHRSHNKLFFPPSYFSSENDLKTAGGSVSVTAERTVSCSLCSVEELITCSIGGFFKGEKRGKKTNKPWSLCSACRDTVLLSHLQEFSAGAHNNQDRYETREEEEEDDEDGYCFWVHSIAHLEKEHLVHAVRGQWRL